MNNVNKEAFYLQSDLKKSSSYLSGLMKNSSIIAILVIVLFSFFYGAQKNEIYSGKAQIIQYDGYGYYLYLPALFIYKDTKQYSFATSHLKNYAISGSLYQLHKLNDSVYYPTYPIGIAVMWYPFFSIAHFYCLHQSYYPADGLSFPYELAIFIASLFYLSLGFIFLRRFLKFFANDGIIAFTLLLIFFGTNFFFYSVFGKELTHTYLFCLMSMFLFYWHQYALTHKVRHLIFSTLAFSLGVLVRNSEVLWILIPSFYGIGSIGIQYKKLFLDKIKQISTFLILAILIYSVFQISYFKLNTNHWWLNGYGDHHFDLMHPNFYYCFFGFWKGWFVYTPLALLFFIGYYHIFKNYRAWFWSILLFSGLYLYVLVSWDDWSYGTTFGFRPIVQSYALFALPLALVLAKASKSSKLIQLGLLCFLTICVFLNLFQTWQYEHHISSKENQNLAFYKRIFLKNTLDSHDKILIDVPKHEFKEFKQTRILYENKNAFLITSNEDKKYTEWTPIFEYRASENLPSSSKIQTTLVLSYYNDKGDYWNSPTLNTEIKDSSSSKFDYWTGLKLVDVIRSKTLDTLIYNQPFAVTKQQFTKIYCHNTSADSILVRYLKIELVE